MRASLLVALPACIAALFGMAHPTCAAVEPQWIFGVHDTGGYTKIEQAGKKGWLVVTVGIGHNPADTGGDDFSFYANRGHGVIVRLNNGYGSDGTLPRQSQYQNFATRCANYVAATRGADIFIIGNETNLPREWPGNDNGDPATGEPITVARYVDCYNKCYNAIKAVKPSAQVCPSPSGTWAPPYPTQGIEGFKDYWLSIINTLGANKVDALILHAYTHGCDPALVTSEAKMGPPYTDIYYNFRVYRNYMAAVPLSMRTKPVYITECDQNIECADPPPVPRHTWNNANNGWVKAIYSEIDSWNQSAGTQKIRCVALFRWDDVPEGEWAFGFSNRAKVITDWLEAMANDYRWTVPGTLMGTVKDASNQPIPGAAVTTSPGNYTALSGANGAYAITGVEPGSYNLTARKIGYDAQMAPGKVVNPGRSTIANFVLAQAAPLGITSASSPSTIIDRSETGVPVSIILHNSGTEDLQIDQAYPRFLQGSNDVSSYYTATPNAANGRVVPRGGSLALDFMVDAHADAPYGPTIIQAYARAWPNAIPNGSFEEGGGIPPTHWFNWTNAPSGGASWSYDAEYRAIGDRSYKLSLSNSPSNVYCTTNTGDGANLLPVYPSTLYYNSIKKRTAIGAGSPLFILVFQEYDTGKAQIGSDHYCYFSASDDWQEVGASYTTSVNAAYARVWTGQRSAGGTPTNCDLWLDDAQLRPTDFYYTSSTAGTADSWTVARTVQTISAAKDLADGTYIRLLEKTIAARYAALYYIQEDDRTSGIRVDGTTSTEPGTKTDVVGRLYTDGAERAIAAK